MQKYIDTQNQKLIFRTNDYSYPYLLEITEFVKDSDNANNYNGERTFRLLDKNFIATGDGYTLSNINKYFPNCELLNQHILPITVDLQFKSKPIII